LVTTKSNLGTANLNSGTAGLNLETADLNFDTTNLNFETADLNFDTTNLNFETADLNFETTNLTTNLNFETADLNFETTNLNFETADLNFETTNLNFETAFRKEPIRPKTLSDKMVANFTVSPFPPPAPRPRRVRRSIRVDALWMGIHLALPTRINLVAVLTSWHTEGTPAELLASSCHTSHRPRLVWLVHGFVFG
jgi:hypothetical protein